jgi:hypothetical protein
VKRLEPLDIKAANARLAAPHPAKEAHFAIVGEQVRRLVIQAFVDQIAVEMLEFAHIQFILAALEAGGKAGDRLFQLRNTICIGHDFLSYHCM